MHLDISIDIALNLHALYYSGSLSYEAKEVFLAALVSEGLFCTTLNLLVIVVAVCSFVFLGNGRLYYPWPVCNYLKPSSNCRARRVD